MRAHRLICACALAPFLLTAQHDRETVHFEYVAEQAARLIEKPAPAASPKLPEELARLSYDDYRNIRFRPSEALWWNDSRPFRVEFFHLGHIFRDSVQIFEFSDTHTQEIPFLESAFNYENSNYSPGFRNSPKGYAGIRVKYPINRGDVYDDLIVFQGASYFRALGKDQAYGLSLRGLAMNTAADGKEDFPRFTKLWLKKPNPGAKSLTVLALLEGEKVTGAYAFEIKPGGRTDIDVRARLYFRNGAASEAGIAPITSMFVFGENSNHAPDDWRPEVHDSDGLLIHADNTWIWHALENLPGRYSRSFPVGKLRGFGLFQRDRDFANYKDLEARYEKRSSAWIQPRNEWPTGTVVLYTFGTDSEATDNINAFWKPDLPEDKMNGPIDLHYNIRLQLNDPPADIARVVETRVGQRTLDTSATTVIIEFTRPESIPVDEIGELSAGFDFGQAAMLGEPVIQYNEPENRIRLFAHFRTPAEALEAPYEMSAQLLRDGHQVSERWSYSWKP